MEGSQIRIFLLNDVGDEVEKCLGAVGRLSLQQLKSTGRYGVNLVSFLRCLARDDIRVKQPFLCVK